MTTPAERNPDDARRRTFPRPLTSFGEHSRDLVAPQDAGRRWFGAIAAEYVCVFTRSGRMNLPRLMGVVWTRKCRLHIGNSR